MCQPQKCLVVRPSLTKRAVGRKWFRSVRALLLCLEHSESSCMHYSSMCWIIHRPTGSSEYVLIEQSYEHFQRQNRLQLTIFSKTTSPFWRNRPSNSRNVSSKAADPNMVVGASYSHTDILKFDSLWAIPCTYTGLPLTRSKISNTHHVETSYTSISVKRQYPQHVNPASKNQFRSFFAPQATHISSTPITDQLWLGHWSWEARWRWRRHWTLLL